MAITISSLSPTNPSVFAGGSLTFSVSATTNVSGATLAYLWQVSNNGTTWLDLPDNGASSITLTNIPITSNNDQIRVAISEFTPYVPVIYNYTVTGTGSSSWTFTGAVSGNNPSITATVGDTLQFAVSSTNGNTFYLKTAAVGGTGSLVTTGVTNNGTQNNTVVWNTAGLAAGTYYYVSAENPNNMVGVITLSPAVSNLNSTVYSNEVGFSRTLTVQSPPSITVIDPNQPSYTLATGSTLSLTIQASTNSTLAGFINTVQANVSPLSFQWQESTDGGVTWSNVTTGTNLTVTETILAFPTSPITYFKQSVLTLSNISFAQNNRRYRCVVSYTKDGVVASNSPVATNAIALFVNPQIIISKQPGTGTDTTTTVSYNSTISGSGNATLSVTAFTTATTTISYSWEYRWSTSTLYTSINPTNPQASEAPFRLVTGTTADGPILNLERIKLTNSPIENTNVLYVRVTISGLSGEQSIVSQDATITLTQTAVINSPSDESAIEDRYGPIVNRDSFPENQQVVILNAGVDVSTDTGLKGPIILGWQRRYNGETGWTDVGVVKNDYGTDLPPATSTSPSTSGIHTFTTPPLRRSTDHLSQYRMYVTYNSGGNQVTEFSNPCTISVFRTAYIDNNPGDSETFENGIASFSVTASPSSGTAISYEWEYSINGQSWSPIIDTSPLLNVTSITFSDYTATVTCSSAHNLSSGDRVYISGATPLNYNGVFTVLSTGLTSTQFRYTMLSIPTGNAVGPFTAHKSPKFSGTDTSTLLITVASASIAERYYRCVITVPDSLSTVESSFGILVLRTDRFLGISSINDKQVQEFNSVSWTINATSTSLATPAFQWQKSTNYSPNNPSGATWTNILGANSSTYTIPSVVVADAGYYRCQVTSVGSVISFSNVARLQVFPVSISITRNIPTSISIDEDFPGTEFAIEATSTIPGVIQYQWELKPAGSSTFSAAPVGFNQTNTTSNTYRIQAPSRTSNNGDVYRCRVTINGNPNTYYTNECTVTVNRVFNYYADAAVKNLTANTTLVLDLSPTYTGTDVPTYQWEASTNGGSTWFNLTDGVNGLLYSINIDGSTTSSVSLFNIPSTLSNARFRCAVTFNQVTVVKYYRNTPISLNISPAGTVFRTVEIRVVVTTAIIPVQLYNDQRQKVGAAIGTVICVPKPAGYIEDVSATYDDVDRWKVALTGQLPSGAPAHAVSSNTRPYGPNDRFPGFIEMRGQLVKAQDFPELARILGNTYGGNIPSSRQYPNYQSTDVFRLPCPYGKYLLGTGNVDNNRSSPSVVPLYAPDGTSGGQIGTAGSMGGEYNFEKQDQLPPGNPNISGQEDGTAPTVSPFLFTVGTHRTDGWEQCTTEVETQFTGTTNYQISDSGGIGQIPLSGPPAHSHIINSIIYVDDSRVWGGTSGGCGATRSDSASGGISDGPEGIINNSRNPSRTHSHALSFDPNDAALGEGTGADTTPPSPGGSFSYTSPGNYVFTVPSNQNTFSFSLYSASGGGGGNDAGNPGSSGGNGARVTGTCTNIPGGSSIRVVIPFAGGGGVGCASNGAGGNGGGSQATGFGGGTGGRSGPNGCSGSGGGGGGAAFMYCETVGSGPNPNGLQRGTILVIVGGGGGGGGSGFHNGVTNPRYPGQNAPTSFASSSINSAEFYTNQSTLSFKPYDAAGASNPASGRAGTNKSGDGGGGGGGGGGWRGGGGGATPGGDVNAFGGGAGSSAYNSSFFGSPPSIVNGYTGGAAGGSNNSGATGSASITIAGSVSVPNPTSGGVNSADHNGNWGVLRGSANQFLTETVNHHISPSSTLDSLSITLPPGTVTMSTRSRTNFDNFLRFYMRNNEPIALQQPYFRLKYLIKAF